MQASFGIYTSCDHEKKWRHAHCLGDICYYFVHGMRYMVREYVPQKVPEAHDRCYDGYVLLLLTILHSLN
jgi:hypothetical protein